MKCDIFLVLKQHKEELKKHQFNENFENWKKSSIFFRVIFFNMKYRHCFK